MLSVRESPRNVVTLVRMCGRLFALTRAGEKLHIRKLPKREREPPLPGTGTVVPFRPRKVE